MEIDGKTVKDATKPLTIHITKEDVKKGSVKDPGACAAARACLHDVKDCTRARVHIGRIYLEVGDKWLRFNTPQSLRSEIIAFDRGGSFSPGTYTLPPISERELSLRGKSHTPRPANHERPLKTKRAKPHVVTGIRPHGANR